ncbi:MAG: hypothetical protein NC320_13690 [Clostridium sp.]|nr:hypothetical protein [Clostridium sp.]
MSYNKKQCGTVKIHLFVPLIGAIATLLFGFILIMTLYSKAGIGLCIILIFLFLMSLFMLLTINQKIEYTPMGFTYRDMFRITHKYNYLQIRKIRYGKDVTIHIKHRIILIDSMAYNGKKFARIAMQYSKKAVIITDSQSKLFNGKIKSPGEFIFVYILIGALPIGMAVWGLFESKNIQMDDLKEYSGVISDYHFDKVGENNDRMAIKLNGFDKTFVTWEIDDNAPEYETFQKDAEDNSTFQVYYRKKTVNSDETISIYQLTCGDMVYVSLADINKDNREAGNAILILSAIIFICWCIYVAISTYVMCNAEKYPKLIKLFVKPRYIIKK